MKVLLDTHAVLWALANDPRLGKGARKMIVQAEADDLAISDITLLEIALLAQRGRITLSGSLGKLLDEVAGAFRVLAISPAIAELAMALRLKQADPFDRVIAASALHHKLLLLSRDRHLAASREVKTLW